MALAMACKQAHTALFCAPSVVDHIDDAKEVSYQIVPGPKYATWRGAGTDFCSVGRAGSRSQPRRLTSASQIAMAITPSRLPDVDLSLMPTVAGLHRERQPTDAVVVHALGRRVADARPCVGVLERLQFGADRPRRERHLAAL